MVFAGLTKLFHNLCLSFQGLISIYSIVTPLISFSILKVAKMNFLYFDFS